MTASGEVVVEYSYDPWGNILAVTGSLASTLGADNPFRYRSYYYDTESCFYYLNSRYYDAKVCRFVNADLVVAGVGGDLRGYNLYTYCFNNPVNRRDLSGNWCEWIESAINWVDENIVQPVAEFVSDVIEDIQNFDITNTDEQKALNSNYFSIYKCAPVIRLPIGKNAGSFGIMFIGDEVTSPDDIRHEYGHFLQFINMGVGKYITDVALPSVTVYMIDVSVGLPEEVNYYGSPWEYSADRLGGTSRKVPQWTRDSYNAIRDRLFS